MPFLIQLLILVLVVGFIAWLINAFAPIDPRFKQVALGILVLILLIYVLSAVYGHPGGYARSRLW